jgi:hypothetical protein
MASLESHFGLCVRAFFAQRQQNFPDVHTNIKGMTLTLSLMDSRVRDLVEGWWNKLFLQNYYIWLFNYV